MSVTQNQIAIKVNAKVYKKDPFSSALGEQILKGGIELMYDIGFEDFTFRKLAIHIGSTEASIYRYFENKHNLLAYLVMWYWSWMDYRIMLNTLNINAPETRLKKAIETVTKKVEPDDEVHQIDEEKLNLIVIRDGAKVYHCISVDKDNKDGFFLGYKDLVQRIADIIMEIAPGFKYPHMLVTTIIEGARHQHYFADHLPRLTDVVKGKETVSQFYVQLAEREIGIE